MPFFSTGGPAGTSAFLAYVALAVSFLLAFPPSAANAQRRDHLTDEEIELVRDVQELDKRMEIFVRAIERRLIAINGRSGLSESELKQLEKEKEKWGELPEGSRSRMLSDIDKILEEAISKIEDVAEHDEKSELFPFAVHYLADSARLLVPRLEKLGVNSADSRDAALINSALEQCSDIIEASAKVPRPDPEARKKKKKS